MNYYCDEPNKKLFFHSIRDFPRQGFCFPDITVLFEETPLLYMEILDKMADFLNNVEFSAIACIESFGYLFGAPLACKLNKRIVLIRKPGKLPRDVCRIQYDMCYDNNRELEIHKTSVKCGEKIVVIDDFLASGNTYFSTRTLVENCGGKVVCGCFVATIPKLLKMNIDKFKEEKIYSYCRIIFDEELQGWKVCKDGCERID
ncbi:MAG: adenine phosphoribosyltransferase [Lachnospiraceae bacterium]|jgi:adenine phosphoribosyltransferase|nr:adenine phosphoribosyltransferase [Lachnospiraceae bacterium]